MKTIEAGPPRKGRSLWARIPPWAAVGAGGVLGLVACACFFFLPVQPASAGADFGDVPAPDAPQAMSESYVPAVTAAAADPGNGVRDAAYDLVVASSGQDPGAWNGDWDAEKPGAAGQGQDAAQLSVSETGVGDDIEQENAGTAPPVNEAGPDAAPAGTVDPALEAALAELAATKAELEAARKALAAEKNKPAPAQAPAQEAAGPVETEPGPESEAEASPEGPGVSEPPEWLYGTLDRALWNNPYDGGPLCQLGYAEIPVPVDGAWTRMYVDFGMPLRYLSQADLVSFAAGSVRPCTASWATITGPDGYGIQFPGCGTDLALYGPLDEYGQVTQIIWFLVLTDDGYAAVAP